MSFQLPNYSRKSIRIKKYLVEMVITSMPLKVLLTAIFTAAAAVIGVVIPTMRSSVGTGWHLKTLCL